MTLNVDMRSADPARVLLVHNFYQHGGGEDVVFTADSALLRARGHHVAEYTESNKDIPQRSGPSTAARAIWSRSSVNRLERMIRGEAIDVLHCHNTFPLISPAAYYAAARCRIPVVQTVHNYRLVCPGATCFRAGAVCEDCVGRALPIPAIRYACYRGSRLASAASAAMLATHWIAGTWARRVTTYIALTAFARDVLIRGGLPPSRIVVKPNFLSPDPGIGDGGGNYALFVGRLTVEKGIRTLLRAWTRQSDLPLIIVGDGPLRDEVLLASSASPQIRYLGLRPRSDVLALMRDAFLLVFPSEWYEGFPMTIIESFACGTPVLASALGSMAQIVEDGRTGAHFKPGDPADLARKVNQILAGPTGWRAMRRNARDEFLTRYTAEKGYQALNAIYEAAGAARSLRRRSPSAVSAL
jgi:glycosyltransferase involved in cell wall biosynthesis